MKVASVFLLIAATGWLRAADDEGIEAFLSFKNSDQLHGEYLGFNPKQLRLQREDMRDPVWFDFSNIRRVVLRKGRSEMPIERNSYAETIHGDCIPGRIVSMDDRVLVMQTDFAGLVEIPRQQLQSLSPTPFGGKTVYQGPFIPDDWRLQVVPTRGAAEEGGSEKPAEPKGWTHAGASWYWSGDSPEKGLILNRDIPDRVAIRCVLSWKSRLTLALAFHADFATPAELEPADEPAAGPMQRRLHISDSNLYSHVFGNAYVLQINPNHAMLYRSVVDDEGSMRVVRTQTNYNNVRLGDSGTATIEIRASRKSGLILLFINGEFVAQWSEIGDLEDLGEASVEYSGAGAGFGYLIQSPNAAVRISDVVVSDWNGMPDGARSMQINDHDVVLSTSGTDRFSGKVNSIRDGRVMLAGRYGDFDLPLDHVTEMHFSRDSLETKREPGTGAVRFRADPLGVITGVPKHGDARHVMLDHPSCGPLRIDLRSFVMMEMQLGESFLDDWDPEF